MTPQERRDAGLVFVGSINAGSTDEALVLCGGDVAISVPTNPYVFLCFRRVEETPA